MLKSLRASASALLAVFPLTWALAGEIAPQTATIASGASLSSAVDLGNKLFFAVQIPSSWTTANLTFQASSDGTNYSNVYSDAGTEVTVTAAASQYIKFDTPAAWFAVRYLKIRSGTSGSPVTQGGDRVLTVIGVP